MINLFEKMIGSHKYLFADLDGTLIETNSGKTFAKNKHDWHLKEDVMKAIENYDPKFLFIVSNQGGIEKGFVKAVDFTDKLEAIVIAISAYIPETVISYRFCASNDKNNPNRKPNTGMIDELMSTFNCKKHQCLMIGDASGKEGQFSDSDKRCAKNAGLKYMDINDFVKEYHD